MSLRFGNPHTCVWKLTALIFGVKQSEISIPALCSATESLYVMRAEMENLRLPGDPVFQFETENCGVAPDLVSLNTKARKDESSIHSLHILWNEGSAL